MRHVVYNSFHGRFSDNPRAIFERLRDRPGSSTPGCCDPAHAAAFPAGRRTVRIDRPEARHALEAADLVVAGTHTEVDWTKSARRRRTSRPGTARRSSGSTTTCCWSRRAGWTTSTRTSPAGTCCCPRTPRAPRGCARRSASTARSGRPATPATTCCSPRRRPPPGRRTRGLGLDDDETAVLYAPTWRDDEKYDEGVPEVPMHLHLGALAGRLAEAGGRHRVLARLHNLMTDRLARRGGAGRGRRVVLPGRQRALPGRRRAGHRLLLGDVRLRR